MLLVMGGKYKEKANIMSKSKFKKNTMGLLF